MRYELDLLELRYIEKPINYSPITMKTPSEKYIEFLKQILIGADVYLTSLYYKYTNGVYNVTTYKSALKVHGINYNSYNIPVIYGIRIGEMGNQYSLPYNNKDYYSVAIDETSPVYVETKKNIDNIIDELKKERSIKLEKEKELKLKHKDIDPFGEENWLIDDDWGLEEKTTFKQGDFLKKILESSSSKIKGKLEYSNYITYWENIFKTRYRNLKNGDVKDIKKLLTGPVALVVGNSLKIFNGNNENIYNFVHTKRNDFIEIWPTQKDKDDYEYHYKLSRTTRKDKNYQKILAHDIASKKIRFAINNRLGIFDVYKYEEDIMKLKKIPDCVLFLKDFNGNYVRYRADKLDMILFRTDVPCAVFQSVNDDYVYVNMLSDISYEQIPITFKNKELDPFDEEDWDDGYYEKRINNFKNYTKI